jgi:hypothetical protein
LPEIGLRDPSDFEKGVGRDPGNFEEGVGTLTILKKGYILEFITNLAKIRYNLIMRL